MNPVPSLELTHPNGLELDVAAAFGRVNSKIGRHELCWQRPLRALEFVMNFSLRVLGYC